MATNRAVSAAHHAPQMGGPLPQGLKIQTPHHLATQRKFKLPKLKYELLENIEVGDPLKFWLARGRILSLI